MSTSLSAGLTELLAQSRKTLIRSKIDELDFWIKYLDLTRGYNAGAGFGRLHFGSAGQIIADLKSLRLEYIKSMNVPNLNTAASTQTNAVAA